MKKRYYLIDVRTKLIIGKIYDAQGLFGPVIGKGPKFYKTIDKTLEEYQKLSGFQRMNIIPGKLSKSKK